MSTSDKAKSRSWIWKWIVAAAVLSALVVGWLFLPVKEWSDSFQSWIEELGA